MSKTLAVFYALYFSTSFSNLSSLGLVYTERKCQRYDNAAMTLVMLVWLKTMQSLQNGLQPHSEVTPLFSMKTGLLASSQICHSVDAYAWCKQALRKTFFAFMNRCKKVVLHVFM